MSSVKSVNKGRREIEREKKEILKRLHKLRLTHDNVMRQMDDIMKAANNAGAQLLKEKSKRKFWINLGPLSSIINQSYGRFVNIENHLPQEDNEMSDSSSESSQTSLTSVLSLESMRSSLSTVGLSVACGASTSNASCQTPIDPKGAGDAKTIKNLSHTNQNNVFIENNQSQHSNSVIIEDSKEEIVIDIKTEECSNAVGNGTGNGNKGKSRREQKFPFTEFLDAGRSSSTESSVKSERESERLQSIDNTPRAICSSDGVYPLASNLPRLPLVNYDTESLASYEREDDEAEYENGDEMDDVPEMVESKQSVSTKHTDNQSAISSASSSNEALSLSVHSGLTSFRVSSPICSIGMELEVVVMDVQSPSDFWVQILGRENGSLDDLLSKHCNDPDVVKPGKNLIVGLHCCVWDDTEDYWYRAVVKLITYNWSNETSIKNVQVRYLDVGTLHTVLPENLRVLSKECAKFPAIAMHCKLAGLVPYGGETEWSSDVNAKIHNWIHENSFQMKVVDFASDGMAIVELEETTKANKVNIGKKLIQKKLAKQVPFASSNKEDEINHLVDGMQSPDELSSEDVFSVSSDEEKINYTLTAEIHEAELPTESEFGLVVTFARSPTSFYAIRKDKFDDHSLLLEELKRSDVEYSENVLPPPPECVKVGTYWAAKFSQDKSWYRAKVIDISKPKRFRRRTDSMQKEMMFFVVFVDFGEKEFVSIKNMRPLREQFCSLPAFALQFALANIQPVDFKPENCNLSREDWEWPDEACNKFLELISMKVMNDNYFVGKIVPEINETFIHNLNAPIPIILTAHKGNLESINAILINSGLATRHKLTRLNAGENGIEEDSNNWEYLNDKYFSQQNSYGNNTNDLTTAIIGYKPTDDSRICHCYNRGLCNDPDCRFEHIRYSALTTDKKPICIIPSVIDLIEQGMSFLAMLTAIKKPDDFYIALPYGLKDFYEVKDKGHETDQRLLELRIALNKYCELKPRSDNTTIEYTFPEFLAAKCNNNWYRISLIDRTEETITGVCIDYGDIIEVDVADVRSLPIQFMHLPSQAVRCCLAGVEPAGYPSGCMDWSAEATDWFEERIGDGNNSFLVIVDAVLDGLISVTMYDLKENYSINDDLISHGFGQRTTIKSVKGG